MGASWKTSALGWLTLVGVLGVQGMYLLDSDPDTVFSWEALVVALTGAGLIAARDNGVSSEKAGAKTEAKT